MISEFRGKNRFLSNFFSSAIPYNGIVYPSVEHAFQAAKTIDTDSRLRISTAGSPGEAKKLGRSAKLRDDWEQVKDKVMLNFLRIKFMNAELRDKLLETGDSVLIEGNTWHDNYWGNCSCEKCRGIAGKNMLGRLLMQVRREM